MLSGFFVILFVEFADQFLEDVAHAVIGQPRLLLTTIPVFDRVRAKVDVRQNEPLDEMAEVRFIELVELAAEVELGDDLLHVVGKAVEVVAEIGLELLGLVEQPPERELRRVVKRLLRRLGECRSLVGNLGFVEFLLHRENGIVRRFQKTVEPSNDGHRQNDVPILATDIHVPQDIVGDAPDEVDDAVVLRVIHASSVCLSFSVTANRFLWCPRPELGWSTSIKRARKSVSRLTATWFAR